VSWGSIRDRVSLLSRGELAGVALLTIVTLVGAGLWYARSLPRPVQISSDVQPDEDVSATASPTPAVLIVDVAGWVRSPGVYEFVEGDRVIDAIEVAGGAKTGAALEALNLAAPLVDGTQVLVPRRADTSGGGVPGVPGGPGMPGTAAKINVNTASAAELESLPGIGEVLAQRIIDHRTENGPFATVDDLVDVSGIGDAILEQIRDDVTV
jgi:competence protein ComEA